MAEIKKLVAAVMTPFMFYYFMGCQTYDLLTLEEVKNYKDDKTFSVITKEGKEFILLKPNTKDELDVEVVIDHVDCVYCTSWEISEDSMLLECSQRDQLSKTPITTPSGAHLLKIIETDIYPISLNDIGVIGVKRFYYEGILYGIGITLLAAGIVIGILISNADFGGGW